MFEENDSDSFELNTDCSELMVGMQCSYNTLEFCKHVSTDDFNTLVTQRFDNGKNTLSVLFLNINGVKSNFDSFLAQAQSITMKFSFICFCETNLKSDEPDIIQVRIIVARNYTLLMISTQVLELLYISSQA